MLRKILTSLFILYIALILPASALAQSSYSFGVPLESVDVYWNSDGTEALQYAITFVNQSGAHPIDYVDVGMPNANFDMSTVTADVNGHNVSVDQSGYQGSGSGFSVVMGAQTIQPGVSGGVHVNVGSITGVLYPDSSDNTYASADFAPTYFGSQYVVGNTDLKMTFHLPPGVALGPATLFVKRDPHAEVSAPLTIAAVAPGLFMANTNALAAAVILRFRNNVLQATEPVTTAPIHLGNPGEDVYLSLYGTGIRGNSGLAAVAVRFGSNPAPALYAGPQGYYIGLDQVNLKLTSDLALKGSVQVSLAVDGLTSNSVIVPFE